MVATTAISHGVGPTRQPGQVLIAPGAGGNPPESSGDRVEPVPARTALTRALACKEGQDRGRLDQRTRIRWQERDRAAPKRSAKAPEAFGIEPRRPRIGGDKPRTEVATNKHWPHPVSVDSCRLRDQRQWRATLDLDDRRQTPTPANGDERRSRISCGSGAPEPGRPASCDERDMGQRFDVLNE